MTVVVAVKVYDGIVLAADSATHLTITGTPPTPGAPAPILGDNLYNKADKVFQLHRDLPIGLATWGGGNIKSASIATLAKDLRRRLMGRDKTHLDWKLKPETYTLSEVADRLVQLMHGELYSGIPATAAPYIGFFLAGYSGSASHPEAWLVELKDPATVPTPVKSWDLDDSGWRAFGQPEAIGRLFNGADSSLRGAIIGVAPAPVHPAIDAAFASVSRATVLSAMPFSDAIDFARFCVDVTIGYVRFLPGSNTVGGAIDVAGISRHEGFKWVQRKHYYPPDLNPRRPHDHDQ